MNANHYIRGIPAAAAPSSAATSGSRPARPVLSLKAKPAEEPAAGEPSGGVRAAFYVDGFNLYHAINDLQRPHLKWVDLRRLCVHLIDKKLETIDRILWCSAEPQQQQKLARHKAYQKALLAVGVELALGHFTNPEHECEGCGSAIVKPCKSCGSARCVGCGSTYRVPSEKEGDVNVAINAVADAIGNKFGRYYLVTADSDQVPTIKMLKGLGREVFVVTPPGRHPSYDLLQEVGPRNHRQLTETHLANSLFVGPAVLKGGKHVVYRPAPYAPPSPRRG